MSAPSAVPAMAPTEVVELAVSVTTGALVPLAEGLAVDVGDCALRQVESSEDATVRMSELPPCRPRESIMTNTTVVPAAISVVQLYEVPFGGSIIVD
jgi:hypothetical protein